MLVINKVSKIDGFLYGNQHPVMSIQLATDNLDYACAIKRFESALVGFLPETRNANGVYCQEMPRLKKNVHDLCVVSSRIQEAAGIPVLDASRVYISAEIKNQDAPKSSNVSVSISSVKPLAALECFIFTIKMFNNFLQNPSKKQLSEDEESQILKFIKKISIQAPTGTNTHNLIRAAHRLNIPIIELANNTYQYGYGINSCVLNSTVTDKTSGIGILLAKSKNATNTLLRIAGIPVPENYLVNNQYDALKFANEIGYPVVIKPDNLEQGVGVESNLKNDEQVNNAFNRAIKFSKKILVEKHIEGDDFRIIVLNGKFIYAVMRKPAAVVGNGKDTIGALIEVANLDPERNKGFFSLMKKIIIDDETIELIAESAKSLGSVPALGEIVVLKRKANVSSGGTVLPASEMVHSENISLFERIAKIARLNLVGIDYISTDINSPWYCTGGQVCEINAQPQVGSPYESIFEVILHEFTVDGGRIPTALILSSNHENDNFVKIVEELESKYRGIGKVDHKNVYFNSSVTKKRGLSLYQDVCSLLINPELRCLIIHTEGHDFLNEGMPINNVDIIIINDWKIESNKKNSIILMLNNYTKNTSTPFFIENASNVDGYFYTKKGKFSIKNLHNTINEVFNKETQK